MDANRRHPSKEEVRAWMARRQVSSRAGLPLPLPSPDEIRRELGWHQLPVARQEAAIPALPLLLAELAALTAVTWYWLLLQLARDCPRPLP
ncbi:hypothetical protein [Pseudoduganella umbonata]|uniref:Uncharacterized protein n=1 Tax=Pseudoduganella umbonata TaxID=864828 RepID=A0A4P8HUM5_9BURK|nr:hypothetical protein [Pseudoduganella umbonata]MBB3223391.1 hypothetical protein [Pseudoduganella umbonata]QCP13707.1 hypothetical protein FCL38_27215 [Pseudoduganella umbonata]